MKTDKLSESQKQVLEAILKNKYTSFGNIKEFDSIIEIEVMAAGHPICPTPVGWCAPGNYIGGGPASCPGGYTTYTWCAS